MPSNLVKLKIYTQITCKTTVHIGNGISIFQKSLILLQFQKSLILLQVLFYIGEMPWKSLQLSLSNCSSIQARVFPVGRSMGCWSSFPGGQPGAQPVPVLMSLWSSGQDLQPGLSLGGCRRSSCQREILQRQEVHPQLLWASFAEGLPTRAELGSAVLLPVLSMQAGCLQLESLISSYLYILIPDRLFLLTVCKESRGICLPLPALK